MERSIENLHMIKLLSLNYRHIDFKFEDDNNYVIGVYRKYDIGKNIIKITDNLYATKIKFKLHFTEKKESESEKIDEIELDKEELNGVVLKYEIEFSTDSDIENEDNRKQLAEELFYVIEPYCRNKVTLLLTESNRRVPDMPYLYSNNQGQ